MQHDKNRTYVAKTHRAADTPSTNKILNGALALRWQNLI